MYGKNWDRIIDIINVVKPECIDKEQVKSILDHDTTWRIEVLDSLYFRKIITIDEYKEYLKKRNERLNTYLECNEKYLKDAEERGDNYDPYTHYCLGVNSFGSVIDGLKC